MTAGATLFLLTVLIQIGAVSLVCRALIRSEREINRLEDITKKMEKNRDV